MQLKFGLALHTIDIKSKSSGTKGSVGSFNLLLSCNHPVNGKSYEKVYSNNSNNK